MVTIGTPLTPNATRIMLLGSGELGKEVTIEAQRFGVEVIAVNRYDLYTLHPRGEGESRSDERAVRDGGSGLSGEVGCAT